MLYVNRAQQSKWSVKLNSQHHCIAWRWMCSEHTAFNICAQFVLMIFSFYGDPFNNFQLNLTSSFCVHVFYRRLQTDTLPLLLALSLSIQIAFLLIQESIPNRLLLHQFHITAEKKILWKRSLCRSAGWPG